MVRVIDERGRHHGFALYSSRSLIALRMFAWTDDEPGPAEWRKRLLAASGYREAMAIDATAYRVVHGEADLLPSIVIDRYDEWLVIQTLSQSTDRRLPALVDLLNELFAPRGILARNDPRVRALEGLEQRVEVVSGDVPDVVSVREGQISYDVDLRHGQKTGLFLDQRENRLAAAKLAHGRALDCFSYQGGFALALARHCSEVVALEISADAARRIEQHAARNGVSNVRVETVNAFDRLRELERSGERFDLVVLDPPAFAKSRDAVPKALAGYKEINLRALKLLTDGGILVTCTCSQHVSDEAFGEVVSLAAADAHASVVVIEQRMQARDHPVLLSFPESHYLKCLVLKRLS